MDENIFKKPSPQQVSGNIDVSQYSPTQQKYLQTLADQPSGRELYKTLSEELGIPDKMKVVEGLTRSILDLEGKLGDVEVNVGERIKGFDVTEAQRQRRVAVEEQPLRDQYLEALRRQEGAQAGLSGAMGQLQQEMGYAQEDYGRPLSILEAMLGFEKGDNTGLDLGPDVETQEILSPDGQWKWDSTIGDWVAVGGGTDWDKEWEKAIQGELGEEDLTKNDVNLNQLQGVGLDGTVLDYIAPYGTGVKYRRTK